MQLRNVMVPLVALIVTLTLAHGALAADLTWKGYRDGSHGCEIEYPHGLFTPDPQQPHKPRRFSSSDENIYFRVMGVENTAGWTPQDIRDKYLALNMPGDITYDRTKRDFLVLSGYRGDSIFYTRVALSDDHRTVCILDITYPRSLKKRFDMIVTRMSHSFTVSH